MNYSLSPRGAVASGVQKCSFASLFSFSFLSLVLFLFVSWFPIRNRAAAVLTNVHGRPSQPSFGEGSRDEHKIPLKGRIGIDAAATVAKQRWGDWGIRATKPDHAPPRSQCIRTCFAASLSLSPSLRVFVAVRALVSSDSDDFHVLFIVTLRESILRTSSHTRLANTNALHLLSHSRFSLLLSPFQSLCQPSLQLFFSAVFSFLLLAPRSPTDFFLFRCIFLFLSLTPPHDKLVLSIGRKKRQRLKNQSTLLSWI